MKVDGVKDGERGMKKRRVKNEKKRRKKTRFEENSTSRDEPRVIDSRREESGRERDLSGFTQSLIEREAQPGEEVVTLSRQY